MVCLCQGDGGLKRGGKRHVGERCVSVGEAPGLKSRVLCNLCRIAWGPTNLRVGGLKYGHRYESSSGEAGRGGRQARREVGLKYRSGFAMPG